MELSMASLVDTTRIEKILLAKKVGQFLAAEQADVERKTVENVARVLAQDISEQVRSVLAYELRQCKKLSRDLAHKIATDIEQVSGPFLQATMVFTEEELASLIPDLADKLRAWVAKRTDLTETLIDVLVREGAETSLSALLRNDMITLPERACAQLIKKHGDNRRLMDHMGARRDLALVIAQQVIDRVSDHFKSLLVKHYLIEPTVAVEIVDASAYEVMWQQIDGASTAQVHAFVLDLKVSRRLTHQTILEMASRGSMTFLESSLALQTGLTIDSVKEKLTLSNPPEFVKLMKKAAVPDTLAPKYLHLVKAEINKAS